MSSVCLSVCLSTLYLQLYTCTLCGSGTRRLLLLRFTQQAFCFPIQGRLHASWTVCLYNSQLNYRRLSYHSVMHMSTYAIPHQVILDMLMFPTTGLSTSVSDLVHFLLPPKAKLSHAHAYMCNSLILGNLSHANFPTTVQDYIYLSDSVLFLFPPKAKLLCFVGYNYIHDKEERESISLHHCANNHVK